MISLSGLVWIVLYLIIAGLVYGLLYWLLNESAAAPAEPFRKIGNIVLAILAVLVVIGILLSLVGGQPIFRP